LVKEFLRYVPPHRIYVEAFAGSAALFFAKPPAEVNVLNDINRELMDFYRKLRDLEGPLACDMRPDKERFYAIKGKSDKNICDFLYLNRSSFSGNMESFSGTQEWQRLCERKGWPLNCGLSNVIKNLEQIRARLKRAILECRDFREVLKKYDSPDTFFYLDPPYWGPNREACLYGKGRCGVTPWEVAEAVKGLKGKVMISYDDHPDVVAAFRSLGPEWRIVRIPFKYTGVKSRKGEPKKEAVELLIMNYEVPGVD